MGERIGTPSLESRLQARISLDELPPEQRVVVEARNRVAAVLADILNPSPDELTSLTHDFEEVGSVDELSGVVSERFGGKTLLKLKSAVSQFGLVDLSDGVSREISVWLEDAGDQERMMVHSSARQEIAKATRNGLLSLSGWRKKENGITRGPGRHSELRIPKKLKRHNGRQLQYSH